MIYSRGKERHNIAAGTVSRVSPRVFKIRDGSPGKEKRRRRRGRRGRRQRAHERGVAK